MRTVIQRWYYFIQTIPDRFYPFKSEVEGSFVRGRKSYEVTLQQAFAKYGPHNFGIKLTFYRATFHFLGSVFFIVLATVLSQRLFGSEVALYLLLGMLIVGIFVQEFHLQPKLFGQLTKKGVIDTLTWVVPMIIYIVTR